MRLAVGSIYGTLFTGSFEATLLWLNGGLDIRTGVMLLGLTQLISTQQQLSTCGCEDTVLQASTP